MTTDTQWIIEVRAALFRVAHGKLRNGDWADDAVSETMVAVLDNPPPFGDAARRRAWLFGVLRNKLVDQVRGNARGDVEHVVGGLREIEEFQISDPDARWDPVDCAQRREFLTDLEDQLRQMPESHARAFVMRECWGTSTDEICRALGLSSGNLWVIMHRVRSRLRENLAAHCGRAAQ